MALHTGCNSVVEFLERDNGKSDTRKTQEKQDFWCRKYRWSLSETKLDLPLDSDRWLLRPAVLQMWCKTVWCVYWAVSYSGIWGFMLFSVTLWAGTSSTYFDISWIFTSPTFKQPSLNLCFLGWTWSKDVPVLTHLDYQLLQLTWLIHFIFWWYFYASHSQNGWKRKKNKAENINTPLSIH